MKTLSFFETNTTIIITIGIAFLFSSIFFFEVFKKNKLSLFLLLVSGLFLCTAMALLDPFLNNWDEQFHALVAKNIIQHPLRPTLYESPILPFDPTNWTANNVWLHKQPLFLWQIAISLKLFGINEFAVRIPSIIMMSILPLLVYRMGKICLNERIGYYGALLVSSGYFIHELLTGFPPSDHNDVAFIFYITSSIWAWVEYERTKKEYWLIVIGLFSGAAILIKWLTGLLVFSGWGLSVLFDKEKRKLFSEYTPILKSLLICFLTFIPWQIYIHFSFPLESSHEYALNSKHFFSVVEGHGGNVFYYIENIRKVYGGGQLVPFLILVSFIFLYKNLREFKYKIAMFSYVVIVYTFFTIASTKMIGFCYIISPIIFLSLAALIDSIFIFVKKKIFKNIILQNIFIISLLLVFVWGNLNLYNIAYKHTMQIRPDDNDNRIEKINDAIFIKSLKGKLPSEDYIILNCKAEKNIGIMFYTNYTAYDKPLNYANYIDFKNKKIKLAVIDNKKLPAYILNDSTIIKIKAPNNSW